MKKLETVLDWFQRDVIEVFGQDLVSIVVYGSAASDAYNPGRSDINTVVVLTEYGMGDIWKAQTSVTRWRKKRIACPWFMTRDTIQDSLDSFPVEFLNMRLSYKILFGEDVLKNLDIRPEDVRLQCERELKGKLLHLREEFVRTHGQASAMQALISGSLVTFTSLFRALLYLKKCPMPVPIPLVLEAACREFGLDADLFTSLARLREKKTTLNKVGLIHAMKSYIAEIQRLSQTVDRMDVKN